MAPGQLPNSSAGRWRILSQQETVGADEQGRAAQGVRVEFESERGLQGSVFVPRARYSVPNVTAAIADYISQLHAVQDSTGPLPG